MYMIVLFAGWEVHIEKKKQLPEVLNSESTGFLGLTEAEK